MCNVVNFMFYLLFLAMCHFNCKPVLNDIAFLQNNFRQHSLEYIYGDKSNLNSPTDITLITLLSLTCAKQATFADIQRIHF